jgi:hypothetical protein
MTLVPSVRYRRGPVSTLFGRAPCPAEDALLGLQYLQVSIVRSLVFANSTLVIAVDHGMPRSLALGLNSGPVGN